MGNYLRKIESLHREASSKPPSRVTNTAVEENEAPPYKPEGHHKGLQNRAGENNCFLNVTVQALWHLDSFRAAVRGMEATADVREISIDDMITIVNSLFAQYEYYEGSAVPPTELRKRLTSMDPERYSLGGLADATEALYSILSQIHIDSCRHATLPGGVVTENDECTPSCLAHSIFGGVFVEQFSCSACRATSEPQVMKRLLHYIYADEVGSIFDAAPSRPSFSSVLSYCLRPVAHECPSRASTQRCQGEGKASLSCLEPPRVLAFCISWAEERASLDKLSLFIRSIDIELSVSDVFPYGDFVDDRFHGRATHELCGLVCFYGMHYICFFRDSSSSSAFLLFDDARVRVVGSWGDVKEDCLRSRYQPVLLLYQLSQVYCPLDAASDDDDEPIHLPSTSPNVVAEKKATIGGSGAARLLSLIPSPDAKLADSRFESKQSKDVNKGGIPIDDDGVSWLAERPRGNSIRLSQSNRLNRIYNVVLDFDVDDSGAKSLGMVISLNNENHLVVIDFLRRANNSQLAAEKCGRISLLDRVLSINGVPVDGWSVPDVTKYLHSLKGFPCVTIKFESKWEEDK